MKERKAESEFFLSCADSSNFLTSTRLRRRPRNRQMNRKIRQKLQNESETNSGERGQKLRLGIVVALKTQDLVGVRLNPTTR